MLPGTWVGGQAMDFYLTHRFTTLRQPSNIVYLPISIATNALRFDAYERDLYRRLYPMQLLQGKAITFMLLVHQHYFVVVFHYQSGIAVTYGRQFTNVTEEYTAQADWNTWNGPHLWTGIADLLGLSGEGTLRQRVNLPSVTSSFQWKQVRPQKSWNTSMLTWAFAESNRLWCRCGCHHRTLHGPWCRPHLRSSNQASSQMPPSCA